MNNLKQLQAICRHEGIEFAADDNELELEDHIHQNEMQQSEEAFAECDWDE